MYVILRILFWIFIGVPFLAVAVHVMGAAGVVVGAGLLTGIAYFVQGVMSAPLSDTLALAIVLGVVYGSIIGFALILNRRRNNKRNKVRNNQYRGLIKETH